ncbi:MAG: DUF6165 family protein [Gemmataceae bacterium]|nr:DUF6165 family protein [Gemmataceae bacterium]MDW8266551.1 DUF6165 family protein [Gemmataceae bacterium]
MSQVKPIFVEISPGELLDKITILQLKQQRITDPAKLHHVLVELASLEQVRDQALTSSPELERLTAELLAVNADIWDIVDGMHHCEQTGDFGPRFVELARAVHRQNDQRARIKRQINELLGSRLMEEKGYQSWGANLGRDSAR